MPSPRKRHPTVDQPVASALKAHVDEGLRIARMRGHDPEVWRESGSTAELRCKRCERLAGAALQPPPGGKNVAGFLLSEDCR